MAVREVDIRDVSLVRVESHLFHDVVCVEHEAVLADHCLWHVLPNDAAAIVCKLQARSMAEPAHKLFA